MKKEIKAFGLALAAVPVALALAGLLQKVGWIDSSKPWSWATLKWLIYMLSGFAYLVGIYLFENDKTSD